MVKLKKNTVLFCCLIVFSVAFPHKGYGQDFGRPILSKITQYTLFGGVGGVTVMGIIWATDPLNPEFKLLDMAIVGLGIGFIGGFTWGVYTSTLNVRSYEKYKRSIEEEYKKNIEGDDASEEDKKKGNKDYLDYSDIFDDDRNYFDQLDKQLNDNDPVIAVPPGSPFQLPPRHDPTEYAETRRQNAISSIGITLIDYRYEF